ncbi:MAG: hypothetical protein ACRDY4_15035 [Acidimicrobiia bacterium]
MSLRELVARARQKLVGPEAATLREDQRRLHEQQQALRVAIGTLMAREIAGAASSCNEAEFRSFSQFGEDGIIEYLIQRCDISPCTFVEIGVETYAEANTRFLAEHRLWRGLIVDQNPRLSRDLGRTRLDWRSQVKAASAFVTRANVQQTVGPFVGTDGLGLLSVDIDGVDYWILEQLVGLGPAMIVAEYNALFGDAASVSIPYDAGFDRRRPEYHNVYYGASLAAFEHLLSAQGYALAACVTAGNNAFFVRSDRLGDVPVQTVADAYRPRRFVEHRAVDGTLTGITERRRQLQDVERLPLIDVTDGRALTVGDILSG